MTEQALSPPRNPPDGTDEGSTDHSTTGTSTVKETWGECKTQDAEPLSGASQSDVGSKDANWNMTEAEELEPLIDMADIWKRLSNSEDPDISKQLANDLAAELRYYFFASRAGGLLQSSAKKMHQKLRHEEAPRASQERPRPGKVAESVDLVHEASAFATCQESVVHPASGMNERSTPCESSAKSGEITAKNIEDMKSSHRNEAPNGESPFEAERSFGEELLFALSCEDKRPQKNVPQMTIDVLTLLLTDIAGQIVDVSTWTACALMAIVDVMTMQLIQSYIYILVESLEKDVQPLADAVRSILYFLANHSNPRELHVMIKAAVARISDRAYIPICSLILLDLLKVWTVVIPRITGKRGLFVRDVSEMLDKLLFNVTRASDIDTIGTDLPQSNGPSDIERAIFGFIASLSEVQQKRFQDSCMGHSRGDTVEAVIKSKSEPAHVSTSQGIENSPVSASKMLRAIAAETEEKERALHDFETECGTTRALAFKLLTAVIRRLPPRPSEQLSRNKPARKAKALPGKMSARCKFLQFLREFQPLFKRLGFDNPVDACQQCYRLLGIDPLAYEDIRVQNVARPKPRRKRKPETFFSLNGMAHYLMISLALGDDGFDMGGPSHLDNTAFICLDPLYALKLVMPYLMTALLESSMELRLIAVEVIAAFLDRVPERSIKTMMELLQNFYGCPYGQAESSWFGLASVLSKAVGKTDDLKHRGFAYETLQALLRKFARGTMRFSVVGVLVLEAERPAMSAQLLTELKDATREIDAIGNAAIIGEYRDRLADTYVPRFLLPRQELLAGLNPAVAACNVGLYLAIGDTSRAMQGLRVDSNLDDIRVLRGRMRLLRNYLAAGRDAMRAIAAVAEHDRKTIPDSKLAKANVLEARSLYDAAGRTLNDCVASICTLDLAIEKLDEAFQKQPKH